MKKKKFSWKNIFILLGFVAVGVCAALPHYLWTAERAKAAWAETVLVNLSIAQNRYFSTHKTYTYDWRELDPLLPNRTEIKGYFAPAPEAGEERFLTFVPSDLSAAEEGFSVGLELAEDALSGKIYAVRVGSLFGYTLAEEFPKPAFSCEADGKAGNWFCRKFGTYIKPFLLQTENNAKQAEKK